MANPSFSQAIDTEVGRCSAISRAKLGPDSTTMRSWCSAGSTSRRIWLVVLPVPTSIPLLADTSRAWSARLPATLLQTSRTPWLGTTDSSSSLSRTASSSEAVARMLSGSTKSLR